MALPLPLQEQATCFSRAIRGGASVFVPPPMPILPGFIASPTAATLLTAR